jgi:hypothetical protein
VSSRTPRAGSYPPLLPLSASSNRQQKEWRRRLELASARGSKHKIVSAWRGLSVGRRSPFRRCDAVTAMFCRAQIFFFFFSYPLRRPRGPCSAHLGSFPSFWRSLPNSRSKGRRSPLKARRSISPREKSGEKSSVGSAPRGGSALDCALQVAIVVVRERSHLERVGDRCGSLAFRLSQRDSTHMLGASPLTA